MCIKPITYWLKALIASIALVACIVMFEEEMITCKYFLWAHLSNKYQQQKLLIEPYFDEEFYIKKYGDAVKQSGLKPIDHFLQKGWQSNDWRNHTDPNPWFNTTLYKERLWPNKKETFSLIKIANNPFVNFLEQPKISTHEKIVEIYAKHDELTRAWLAIEGFFTTQ